MLLDKSALLAAVARRTKDIPSDVFGGDVHIQELSRAEWRAAGRESRRGEDASGTPLIDVDTWNSMIFAAGVVDGEGKAIVSADDVRSWPNRDDVWAEVLRIATEILELSEVGRAPLSEPSTD
jgi:hypothetical protein